MSLTRSPIDGWKRWLTMVPAPKKASDWVACYVNDILDCYSKLSGLPDMIPSPEINDAFERLVNLCCQTPDGDVAAKVGLRFPTRGNLD